MSYLLDKKEKRKKFFKIALGVLIFIVLFYFRMNIWNGFSYVGHVLFRPVLVTGSSLGDKFNNLGAYFSSKKSLYLENQILNSDLLQEEARISNYNSLLAENNSLKEILGRKEENVPMLLSAILSKSSQNAYDTLVVDVGTKQEANVGDMVFALGNVPIGRVAEVYPNSSKIILFSNQGEKTQAIIPGKDIFIELIGRGGGNFEMVLPRDIVLQKGDQVIMPGINPYILAVVETTISDPRDPFTKALLTSPVNIQELKFVQIEKQK